MDKHPLLTHFDIYMHRILFEEVREQLVRVLRGLGFSADRAQRCAGLFAETTRDGVYTHGISRFPRFVAMVRNGSVDVSAEASLQASFGAMERWDGQRGPGNLNAYAAMERAIALCRAHGIGYVALRNTNHWMRGGTYGWQAADAGLIGICWTNTMPNLPPWGGAEPCIGNNPLVIAVPRASGHVVLDIAMSQFSYGALESYRIREEMLPFDGGFDVDGKLTRDPAAIEKAQRPLPVGYWKGSGLSIVLDMIAALTSLGKATYQLAPDPLRETGLSQVFMAINPGALQGGADASLIIDEIVTSLHGCKPEMAGKTVRYPGERTYSTRTENQRLGLPVQPELWAQILSL